MASEGAPPGAIAEIHATVDLDRTLVDLGLPVPDPADLATDALLGARVWIVDGPGDARLAIAEPSTEGRLAATLARRGEGPAGWYVQAAATLDELREQALAGGLPISQPADGPFGREVLALGSQPFGRHLILVDRAAVPSRP